VARPVWLITRYDEAKALLHDPRLGKDLGIPPTGVAVKAPFATMLETDSPDHTRRRRLVVKAFTARSVERLRLRVAEIADQLLDVIEAAAPVGPVDLMESFAAPLPIRVIGELLGKGNGILALLQNPAQLARLRGNAAELPSAVEEFMRFGSPVHIATMRFTTVPVRVGVVNIPARQLVMIALLAANRDGGQFPDPDQLDITRKPNAHLSFGYGAHYCIGAPLARLEAQVAFVRLLVKFDQISLASDAGLEHRNSTLMRGLKALPVVLGGAMAPAVPDVAASGARRW
jgi:cytochrome P450